MHIVDITLIRKTKTTNCENIGKTYAVQFAREKSMTSKRRINSTSSLLIVSWDRSIRASFLPVRTIGAQILPRRKMRPVAVVQIVSVIAIQVLEAETDTLGQLYKQGQLKSSPAFHNKTRSEGFAPHVFFVGST